MGTLIAALLSTAALQGMRQTVSRARPQHLLCSRPPLLLEGNDLELTQDENIEMDDDMPPSPPSFSCEDMPGVSAPLGFFDPAGFSDGVSEGRIKFYREVELKHSRVAMLAALGFPLAETFHPLFGGEIDVPSYGECS